VESPLPIDRRDTNIGGSIMGDNKPVPVIDHHSFQGNLEKIDFTNTSPDRKRCLTFSWQKPASPRKEQLR